MARTIGLNNGAEAVKERLNAIDPHRFAYNRFFGLPTPDNEGTAQTLIKGHNEVHRAGGLGDEVSAIKAVLNRRPF